MADDVLQFLRRFIRSLALPLPGETRKIALSRVAVALDCSPRTVKRLYYGEPGQLSQHAADALLARREEVLTERIAQSETMARRLAAEAAALRQELNAVREDGCCARSDGKPVSPWYGSRTALMLFMLLFTGWCVACAADRPPSQSLVSHILTEHVFP